MKTEEINIRDPYVLEYQGKYYLYGTRSSTAWGLADGFDCYVSEDLNNWSEPIEIFHRQEGFWADRNYWAPECHYYKGEFYLFASFKAEGRHLGIQILKSSDPTGPFTIHSDGPVTPLDWECLDGTLYLDLDGIPHLIFSHSFSQHPNGAMCELELTSDLSAASGSPKLLFEATDAAWAIPFPYGEIEFGIKGDMYFSDGPFLHRLNSGRLALLWSSWSKNGYAMGIAYSDNDEIDGKWLHDKTPLYGKDGGHGMIFNTPMEKMMLTLHYPNEKTQEKPIFIELEEINNCLGIKL